MQLYTDGDAWFGKDKAALPVTYPNLPYWVEPGADGVKITQSLAILRHVGAKAGLLGGAPGSAGAAAVDEALFQAVDFRRVITNSAYSNNPTYEGLRDTELPKWLSGFEKALAGKEFIAGGAVSIADFQFWDGLDQAVVRVKETDGTDLLATYPNLAGYYKRIASLPPIAEYIASKDFVARPFNGSSAAFK
jgi:glutathione S-transferase